MTQVRLERDDFVGTASITAKGHATGSVEVCAAISCLLYTIAGWLQNSDFEGYMVGLKEGDACIMWYTLTDKADALYEFAEIGFKQLAASYPEYIRVE